MSTSMNSARSVYLSSAQECKRENHLADFDQAKVAAPRQYPTRADHAHTRKSSSENQNQKQENLPGETNKASQRPKTTPMRAFQDWFAERFPESLELSVCDLGYIEQRISSRGVDWQEFIHLCRGRLTGRARSGIALVKWYAEKLSTAAFPPREIVPPPPEPEWGSCSTCRSKAGRFDDGTPCPDCKLGRDLARADAKIRAQKETSCSPKTQTQTQNPLPSPSAPGVDDSSTLMNTSQEKKISPSAPNVLPGSGVPSPEKETYGKSSAAAYQEPGEGGRLPEGAGEDMVCRRTPEVGYVYAGKGDRSASTRTLHGGIPSVQGTNIRRLRDYSDRVRRLLEGDELLRGRLPVGGG